ncbi:MAG: NupC/NupG family nucleoside CNT transporter [Spirochaetota bacterium]|nr:NupC/NupG family nucleoside CNT transporter [Spirochaetota bacterium]
MRFIGLIGIVLFMGLAYIFSKNRKAINWKTIAWGLGLQVSFAMTILGDVNISFITAGFLSLLITVYIAIIRFIPWCQNNHPILWVRKTPSFMIVLMSVIKIFIIGISLGYFFGKESEILLTNVINIIWGVVILVWVARKFNNSALLQKTPINSILVLLAINMSLGLCISIAETTLGARGTISQNIQQLSIGVGNFLSIPTNAGASMIFGPLATIQEPWYFLFFVQVLPTIIFFSALISVLYYIGVIQVFIEELSQFMRWTMQTSGAETLSCAGNIFIGQTEAPILIKPYIKDMTKSEIHAVMTGGFSTIAGSVFAGLVAMGIDASYLISASIMSAPAALMLSKMWYPETESSKTTGDAHIPKIQISDNIIGAAAQGTAEGLQLALNVGAMLLAFIALVTVVNMGLGTLQEGLSLDYIFGHIFQYVALVMGVVPQDAQAVGTLLGSKIAINEFVAYGQLAEFVKNGTITPRSQAIATYALCGFANFSSIGIQIGGITPMAPERKTDIASLGFTAMWAGACASWMTATIAGIFIR